MNVRGVAASHTVTRRQNEGSDAHDAHGRDPGPADRADRDDRHVNPPPTNRKVWDVPIEPPVRVATRSPLSSLRTTTEEHHARLLPHADRLLVLAEMVGHVDCAALHALFEDEYGFVVGQLVPHMASIERTLYDRLEQLMDGRHSMAPMRQEHAAMGRLVEELGNYRQHVEGCSWSAVEGMALRRALYRLHSILKVHLAEEGLYLRVLEQHLSDEEKDLLARGIAHAMTEPL